MTRRKFWSQLAVCCFSSQATEPKHVKQDLNVASASCVHDQLSTAQAGSHTSSHCLCPCQFKACAMQHAAGNFIQHGADLKFALQAWRLLHLWGSPD